jgi:hypothetical protein
MLVITPLGASPRATVEDSIWLAFEWVRRWASVTYPPPGSDLAQPMICMEKTAKTGLFLTLETHFWG